MTPPLVEFNERMRSYTSHSTHTQFMHTLTAAQAQTYIAAFDRWLVKNNPQATGEDYYWRALLFQYFFPNPRLEAADLRSSVALDPTNVDVWVSLGHMAKRHDHWNQALEYYSAGIETSPGNFFPWYGRASVHMHFRRFTEALQDINTAISIHPNLAYGYEVRALIHDKMGDLEQALADLDRAACSVAAEPRILRLRDAFRKKLQARIRKGA